VYSKLTIPYQNNNVYDNVFTKIKKQNIKKKKKKKKRKRGEKRRKERKKKKERIKR